MEAGTLVEGRMEVYIMVVGFQLVEAHSWVEVHIGVVSQLEEAHKWVERN